MQTIEEGRAYLNKLHTGGFSFIYSHTSWMTPVQREQLADFCEGRAIPTDPELVAGLQYCTDQRQHSRMAQWIYGNVSGFFVDEPSYSWWCHLIREHRGDPDFSVDEGL